MSYEGELIAHYNGVHQKLLGSPPIRSNGSKHVTPPIKEETAPEPLLIEIQAIKEQNKQLLKRIMILEIKTGWTSNIYPQNQHTYTQEYGITIDDIFQLVRIKEQFNPQLMLSQQRSQKVCDARNIIYYLAANHTCKSLPQIGAFMKRDHTTILHGKRRISEHRKTNPELDFKLCWYEAEIARLTKAKNAT